jgi:hypothetical protein
MSHCWRVDKQWEDGTRIIYHELARVVNLPKADLEAKHQIVWACSELLAMLLFKNESYGNSALEPDMILPVSATPADMIRIRINDKLKRLKMGKKAANEDTEFDLIGYFVLLRIANHNEAMAEEKPPHSASVLESKPALPEEVSEARPAARHNTDMPGRGSD